MEPYEGRNAESVVADIKYIIDTYGNHPAFYRDEELENRPLFFFYDSYLTRGSEWATIFSPRIYNISRANDNKTTAIRFVTQSMMLS